MMVGPDVYICNECVDLIKSMMDEEIEEKVDGNVMEIEFKTE